MFERQERKFSETKSSTSPLSINKSFVESMAYLFTVDISTYLTRTQTLSDFEQREKGYAAPWLQAISYAVKNKDFDKKITHSFLKNIHKIAMSHFEGEKETGTYKTVCNNFSFALHKKIISGKVHLNVGASATFDGLSEFIEESLIGDKNSVWNIEVEKNQHGCQLHGRNNKLYCIDVMKSDLTVKNISLDDAIEKLKPLITGDYKWAVQSGEDSSDFRKINYDSILDSVIQKLDIIFSSYTKSILNCVTNDEKIRVIATHIQKISQLHPFLDGNTRTCYALLQALLHEEGLLFSLMINPNCIELHSKLELVEVIKEGQRAYQTLCLGTVPTFKDVTHPLFNDRFILTPKGYAIPNGEKATKAFIDAVESNLNRVSLIQSAPFNLFIVDGQKEIACYQLMDASAKKGVTDLRHVLGNDILKKRAFKQDYEIQRQWLNEVNKVNPNGLDDLAKIVNIKKTEFLEKIGINDKTNEKVTETKTSENVSTPSQITHDAPASRSRWNCNRCVIL